MFFSGFFLNCIFLLLLDQDFYIKHFLCFYYNLMDTRISLVGKFTILVAVHYKLLCNLLTIIYRFVHNLLLQFRFSQFTLCNLIYLINGIFDFTTPMGIFFIIWFLKNLFKKFLTYKIYFIKSWLYFLFIFSCPIFSPNPLPHTHIPLTQSPIL